MLTHAGPVCLHDCSYRQLMRKITHDASGMADGKVSLDES